MKRLLWVPVVALAGCPDWDALTEERCHELRSNTGVCEGTILTDAGSTDDAGHDGGLDAGVDAGVDAGSADAGDGGAPLRQINWVSGGSSGFLFLEDLVAPSATVLSTGNDVPTSRRPVLVGETPSGGLTFTVEDEGPAGFQLWLSSSANQRGNSPNPMSTSAANDRTWWVGTNYSSWLAVDSLLDTGQNADWPFQAVTALAQVVATDGGPAFIGGRGGASNYDLFSVDCDGCPVASANGPSGATTMDSATGDSSGFAWFSARVGAAAAARSVRVYRGNLGLTTSGSFDVPNATTNARTLIACSAASTQQRPHLAWVSGDVLHLAELDAASVLHDDTFDFGAPVVLHALADNGSGAVAVVSVAERLVAVIHRHGETPDFFLVDPSAGFVPSAAHLRDQLRLAGACVVDGGTVNCNGASNRVLIFGARLDGGSW